MPRNGRFTGVYRMRNNRWRSQLCHRRRLIQIGVFDTADEAAHAWDAAAISVRGQTEGLNFQESLALHQEAGAAYIDPSSDDEVRCRPRATCAAS